MQVAVQSIRASDAEAVERLLSREYVTRLLPSRDRTALSISSTEVGPLSLGRAVFDMSCDLRGSSPGVVGIARARAGRLSYAVGGDETRRSGGDLFVAVDPESDYVLRVDDADVDHTMIDLAVFDEVVEPRRGRGLRLEGHSPVDARAAATWMRTWRLVEDVVVGASSVLPELVVGHAARLLAAVTLTTFPNDAVVLPESSDRRDAHPAAVRRAISFMETHPDLDLTVVAVARASHVSTRALQLAFRRHLDTTPMAYLRRVRLDRAHAELVDAAPGDGTNVTAVAGRWGWARPSRFAAAYRAAYGHLPSDDLARTGAFPGR